MKKFFKHHYSKHAIVVALLWLFAPAAWYLMWRDKKYHSWFPPLLYVNGFVIAGMVFIQTGTYIPWMQEIYSYYGAHPVSFLGALAGVLMGLYAIIHLIFGIYFKRKVTRHGRLVDEHIGAILAILLIDSLIGLGTGLLKLLP